MKSYLQNCFFPYYEFLGCVWDTSELSGFTIPVHSQLVSGCLFIPHDITVTATWVKDCCVLLGEEGPCVSPQGVPKSQTPRLHVLSCVPAGIRAVEYRQSLLQHTAVNIPHPCSAWESVHFQTHQLAGQQFIDRIVQKHGEKLFSIQLAKC